MVIVVTGMVGIDKKKYLQNLCALAKEKGQSIELCNVGEMMYNEAPDIAPGKILDISMKRLNQLRRSVFKDIIARSKQVEHLIVNTHATFRWRHGLFPAVDFDQIRQLNPDIFICIIDSILALHKRLTDEHTIRHKLKDLIVWREEEILGTEMLCKGVDEKLPFYALARGHDSETIESFYKLIFEPESKKAYLSFPMTHVTDLPEIQSQIDIFRAQLKTIFTCFDPADVEEAYLPVYAEKAIRDRSDIIEVTTLGQNIQLDLTEVVQIESDINSQTYARDFLLIDQADMIISYIPHMPDGRAIISSGVERELQHAHEAAKEVFVIWTADRQPSVFVTQTATKVFTSLEQALNYFKGNCK